MEYYLLIISVVGLSYIRRCMKSGSTGEPIDGASNVIFHSQPKYLRLFFVIFFGAFVTSIAAVVFNWAVEGPFNWWGSQLSTSDFFVSTTVSLIFVLIEHQDQRILKVNLFFGFLLGMTVTLTILNL